MESISMECELILVQHFNYGTDIFIIIQTAANHRSEFQINRWEAETKYINRLSWLCQLIVVDSIHQWNWQQLSNEQTNSNDDQSDYFLA